MKTKTFLNMQDYWIDDDNIAVIIGFGMGTVAVGGNVFKYNIPSKHLEQVTFYSSDIQITKVSIKEEYLELSGIKYIDNHLNDFKEYNDKITLNRIDE